MLVPVNELHIFDFISGEKDEEVSASVLVCGLWYGNGAKFAKRLTEVFRSGEIILGISAS